MEVHVERNSENTSRVEKVSSAHAMDKVTRGVRIAESLVLQSRVKFNKRDKSGFLCYY